jgi:ABC-type transport system involved in cytochrome c biogenesis permease subunit
MSRYFPWLVAILAAAWILPAWKIPSVPAEQPQLYEFARIPVVHNGRIKPMDTIARIHLKIISNRETLLDEKRGSLPAVEWLLHVETDLFRDPEGRAQKDRIFRIDHPQLRDALGLPVREGYRYSIEEFGSRLTDLADPLKGAHDRKEKGQPLDAFEKQLLEFEQHIGYYQRLAQFAAPHLVPPLAGREWRTLSEAAPQAQKAGMVDPGVDIWRKILTSYAENNVPKFNAAVEEHLRQLELDRPKDVAKAKFEVRFNNLDPFNKCKWLYLAGFVLACLAWMGWSRPLNRAAWGLMAFTLIVHSVSLVGRMYISGRPPVTNLYSSAIFIGWGCAVLGLVLELIFRMGVGNIVTAVAGFVTLQIAHILAADGDTMEVLQAVLDTQFWLATHVTCITLGYATTYVAGLLGLIFIIRGVFTPSLTPEAAASLSRMAYGTTCFAMFFSFVGTVLGGLWADDSWGRFWGWDPKENGALMIVLWNALLLHARWGGMVRDRGIAVMAVLGNIVVSWSWFGVNQLGKGLHSYGFTDGIALTLVVFALSQLAIAGCGMIPRENWRSKLPAKGARAAEENGSDHA